MLEAYKLGLMADGEIAFFTIDFMLSSITANDGQDDIAEKAFEGWYLIKLNVSAYTCIYSCLIYTSYM